MKHRIKLHAVCATLLVTGILGTCGTHAGTDPDPTVQREIDGVVASIAGIGDGRDTTEVLERIGRLETAVDGDRERLLLELAAYLSTANGTEQAMGAALLLEHLRFSPEEIIRTVAPRIGTPDPRLRRVYGELLGTVDRPGGGDPDFDPYLPYLEAHRGDPALPLIEYLYSVSAPRGLSALAAAYEPDLSKRAELERAAETVARALSARGASPPAAVDPEVRKQLETMSRSETWWVLLFVRRTLDLAPEFGTPEIRSRLDGDSLPRAALE